MKQKLILFFSTLIIIFIFTEITFTIIVDKDLDGNLSYNYVHLKPFQLPILETKKKIDELLKHKLPDSLKENYSKKNFKREYFNVRLLPDSLLGWSPNPYFKSSDELYIYNKDGIRSNNILHNYSQKEGLRIAIFGDSYSHGDEVKFNNTIGNYLQNLLSKQGINAEVLNFAVSGYGMDQAFLRWQLVKEKFQPDIVILGVQFENVKRHINLLRPFYYYTTEIPYSKPRFIISGNKLHLIKNPITDISKTVGIIEDFNNWEFRHFEGFYSKKSYNPNFLYYSKSFSFVSSAISQIFNEMNFYKPESESYQVTYKLFEQFKTKVENENEIFIPVHLPVKNDFDFLTQQFLDIAYNKQFIYDNLFEVLKHKTKFVEPYNTLSLWGSTNSTNKLFVKRHYSSVANNIIANKIFEFMQKQHSKLLKSNMGEE